MSRAASGNPAEGMKVGTYAERSEEPPVLPCSVPVLQQFFDRLLRVLPLAGLLEGIGGNGPLEALKLQCVTGGEEMCVVHRLWFESPIRTSRVVSLESEHAVEVEYELKQARTLMNGLTLLRLARVFAPMRLVTLRG